MGADKIGVHTTHCCKRCGCKYGDSSCPVKNGLVEQVYDCEDCESNDQYFIEELNCMSEEDFLKLVSKSNKSNLIL